MMIRADTTIVIGIIATTSVTTNAAAAKIAATKPNRKGPPSHAGPFLIPVNAASDGLNSTALGAPRYRDTLDRVDQHREPEAQQ